MSVSNVALIPILHSPSEDASLPSITALEASLRGRLRELRGENSLRKWVAFLEEEVQFSVAPNTVRSYEPEGDRSIPVDYIIAVGVAKNRNPFWILTGTGPEHWDGIKGRSGAVAAAAQVLENIVGLLRSGALPPSLVEQPLPTGPAREIGEALETLLKLSEKSSRGRGG